ncbi:MAG: AraC family transcriptional regulator [Clostridiales bacterium]|nr:AraC family transcriptional regulator [Clostridiales bacterium]
MEQYLRNYSMGLNYRDLRLCFCGYEQCGPLHHYGPVVRPHYIIHYILSGRGIYQVGNERWELHEGEGFLIEPDVQTFYEADSQEPWEYCWVGFEGELVPDLLGEIGLGDGRLTFYCKKREVLLSIVRRMMENQRCSGRNDLLLQSQLYLFFGTLSQDAQVVERQRGQMGSTYVNDAIEFIHYNYYNDIRITDIASYVGIDRSYLYKLFQVEAGMSPNQYLSNFRLTRAAWMLEMTRYSVESVGYSCGYRDPLVFSKAFKRKYGMAPMAFRKEKQTGSE